MSVMRAYEKMFEDGSAYQPIKINQPTPSLAEAEGKIRNISANPIGDKVDNNEDNRDYSEFDRVMENKINKIRARGGAGDPGHNISASVSATSDIRKLEKRIELIEKALEMVMTTQTKLIEGYGKN